VFRHNSHCSVETVPALSDYSQLTSGHAQPLKGELNPENNMA